MFFTFDLGKIDFESNSELTCFRDLLFHKSPIQFLTFPASLKTLVNNWCFEVKMLNNVFLQLENNFFSYSDDSHKMIIKKSEENLDIYDEFAFACRNCEILKILSNTVNT